MNRRSYVGKGNPFYGKYHTEETKRKLSELAKIRMVGKNNPRWNPRKIDKEGYVHLSMPEHPYADARGYIKEHRYIMEQILERYLTPTEVVHHKNGIRDDNRPENLQLFANNNKHMSSKSRGNIEFYSRCVTEYMLSWN